MISHLAGEEQKRTTLWRIVRTDGEIFTFTDHDEDVVYGGETYAAALGYKRTAMAGGSDLAVGGGDVLGMLDDSSISITELRAGLWDHAEIRIFDVNWSNLAQGEIKTTRGWLGEVIARDDGSFNAELRDLAQPLQITVGSYFQAECRADLGDSRCTIDLTPGGSWTQTTSIATVTDSVTLVLANDGIGSFADGWFEGGVCIWNSGTNDGVNREILSWTSASRTLVLLAPPPFTPSATDQLYLQPGCDKRRVTCRTKFNNALNHRGEPSLPGPNAIIKTPNFT
jgi:uncharacterized phage protein (TIGR02218 family)